jgi:hypothetical protein
MPKIKLMQPTSLEVTKNKCPAGWFYNTLTEEKYEQLPCIFLVLGKSRVKWKKPFKRGEEPICRSFDSIHKFDDPRMFCDHCPDSKWENKSEGENKPACNMSYVWLGVVDDGNYDKVFRMIVPGMSVSPTKDYFNVIAPTRLAPFCFRTVLTSEFKENDQGAFYVVKYNFAKPEAMIQRAQHEFFAEKAQSMKDLFMEAMNKDAVDVSAAEAEGDKEGALF